MTKKLILRFLRDEEGAVTVDWVMLTAGVVAFGIMVVATLNGEMGSVGARMDSFLSSQTIQTTF
jgi:Flp pilus assembly pilin Flp